MTKKTQPQKTQGSDKVWLYGVHTVEAALLNPNRTCYRLLLLNDDAISKNVIAKAQELHPNLAPEKATKEQFLQTFGPQAVHQGVALQTLSLKEFYLEDLSLSEKNIHLLALDQVTDPHNIGAIIRSAAVFETAGIIVTDYHSPLESNPALAKAASGALEFVPIFRVTNLVRTLESLKSKGFWCIGLDEDGDCLLQDAPLEGKIVIVMGAEGKGLRRLTSEKCDFMARLPTSEKFSTLNVSNAAAITLYEVMKHRSNKD